MAVRVNEVGPEQEQVDTPGTPHRVWTGGHAPKGGHTQRQRIPTPDEQLAIVDCVD